MALFVVFPGGCGASPLKTYYITYIINQKWIYHALIDTLDHQRRQFMIVYNSVSVQPFAAWREILGSMC